MTNKPETKREYNRQGTSTNARWTTRAGTSLKAIVGDLGIGLKLLPDVRWFRVETNLPDELFEAFDVKRKEPAKLELQPFTNKKINRYVVWQFIRLRDYRKKGRKFNPVAYWRVGWRLMRSRSFQVMALNSILNGWYKKYPYFQILKIMDEVDTIVRKKKTWMEFARVYIPKSNNKWRPLGCPTPAWRIFLHMYTLLLQMAINPWIKPNQHAYVPGRGVLTAWQQIVRLLGKGRDIYEFDLKGFFDNVNTKAVLDHLHQDFAYPYDEQVWAAQLFRSTPKLPKEELLDETAVHRRRLQHQMFEVTIRTRPEMDPFTHPSVRKSKIRQWEQDKIRKNLTPGLPQGAPFSPLLSILPLQYVVDGWTVLYADDGLQFVERGSKTPRWDEENARYAGVIKNEEKSGWVLKDGVWLRPLVFLGMEYDGKTFRARTRGGATLEWDDSHRFLNWLAENWRTLSPQRQGKSTDITYRQNLEENFRESFEVFKDRNPDWEEDFKSRFLGFMFSRLQGNDWNPETSLEFELRYTKNSLLDQQLAGFMRRKCIRERITLYNSSSFAVSCLLRDRTVDYNLRRGRLHTISHVGIRLLREWRINRLIRWCFT